MALGCLHGSPLREHTKYLRRYKRLPLRPPTIPTREGGLFADLRRSIPKPKSSEAREKSWISAATWRLVNERLSVFRDPARYQALIWRLGRSIKASLREDRRRRMEEAGEEVKRLLGTDPPPSTRMLGTG